MLDFDFDVVTGPSKATCPAPSEEQPPADEQSAALSVPERSAGS